MVTYFLNFYTIIVSRKIFEICCETRVKSKILMEYTPSIIPSSVLNTCHMISIFGHFVGNIIIFYNYIQQLN